MWPDWLNHLRDWGPEVRTALRITMVLALAWLVHALAARLVWRLRMVAAARASGPENAKWIETVGRAARYALSVVTLLVAGMLVLNELGISIAPILGAAGVVGLAIGFGSQTLVRDVITGAFLLFEDAVAVGDVVQLGGLSGVVEQLTIRSIKLRAVDGSVHIIPFSAVTTVTNMTRDFGFAVLDISVAYGEDTDRVCEVLREIAAEVRTDAKFGPVIRDDLEIMGVERLADSGVVIRSRIKTDPASRWSVGREFNRRIKQRFDRLGIEIPYPHQKLVIEGHARHPAQEDFPDLPPRAKLAE
jgi:moderate conductance mechanosensitive channel